MKKTTQLLIAIFILATSSVVVNAQDVNNPNGYVQVYEISSELDKNKYDQYTYENDSVIVNFLFWSSQGKVSVKIENKLSVPIYLNWTKSTYVVEGVSIPMTPYEESLSEQEFDIYEKYKALDPTLTDMEYEWKTQANGGVKKDQIISIQPKSTYTKGNYYIIPRGGYVLDTASNEQIVKHSSQKNSNAFVYSSTFTKENSPYKFGVRLLYSTDKSVASKVGMVNQDFYVSRISEMDAKHFRGKKVGKTPEGFYVYKFPERNSAKCYIEIDRRNSVRFNKGFYRE